MSCAPLRRRLAAIAVLLLLLGGIVPGSVAAQEAPPVDSVEQQPPIEGWTDLGDGCWSYVIDGAATTIACYDEATSCYSETTLATGDVWWQCSDPTTGCVTDSTGYSDCGDPTTGAIGWYIDADGCTAYWDGTANAQVTCSDETTGCTTVTYGDGSSWWQCVDPVLGCVTDSTGYSDCGDPTTGAIGWYTDADGCTAYWDGAQDSVVQCTDEATGCTSQRYPDGSGWWQCIDPTTGCVTDASGYDSCADNGGGGVWEDRGDGCQVYVENGVDLVSACTDATTGCYTESHADGSGWWYCIDPVTTCYSDSAGNTDCGDPTTGAVGWYQHADGCIAYWDGAQDSVVQCTDEATGCTSQRYPDGSGWWQCIDPTTGCVTDSWGGDSCAAPGDGWYPTVDGCYVLVEGGVETRVACVDATTGCTTETWADGSVTWMCFDPITLCVTDSWGTDSCAVADGGCVVTGDGISICSSLAGPLPGAEPLAGEEATTDPVQRGAITTVADAGGLVVAAPDGDDGESDDADERPFADGVRTFDGDAWYVTPRL